MAIHRNEDEAECVVLVHGLARGSGSFGLSRKCWRDGDFESSTKHILQRVHQSPSLQTTWGIALEYAAHAGSIS